MVRMITMTASPLGMKCLLPRNLILMTDVILKIEMSKFSCSTFCMYRYSSLLRIHNTWFMQHLFCIFILSTSFLQNYFVTFRLQHLYKTRSHCTHISVGPLRAFITLEESIAVVCEVRGQTVTGFEFLIFHHSVQIHRVQGGAGGGCGGGRG